MYKNALKTLTLVLVSFLIPNTSSFSAPEVYRHTLAAQSDMEDVSISALMVADGIEALRQQIEANGLWQPDTALSVLSAAKIGPTSSLGLLAHMVRSIKQHRDGLKLETKDPNLNFTLRYRSTQGDGIDYSESPDNALKRIAQSVRNNGLLYLVADDENGPVTVQINVPDNAINNHTLSGNFMHLDSLQEDMAYEGQSTILITYAQKPYFPQQAAAINEMATINHVPFATYFIKGNATALIIQYEGPTQTGRLHLTVVLPEPTLGRELGTLLRTRPGRIATFLTAIDPSLRQIIVEPSGEPGHPAYTNVSWHSVDPEPQDPILDELLKPSGKDRSKFTFLDALHLNHTRIVAGPEAHPRERVESGKRQRHIQGRMMHPGNVHEEDTATLLATIAFSYAKPRELVEAARAELLNRMNDPEWRAVEDLTATIERSRNSPWEKLMSNAAQELLREHGQLIQEKRPDVTSPGDGMANQKAEMERYKQWLYPNNPEALQTHQEIQNYLAAVLRRKGLKPKEIEYVLQEFLWKLLDQDKNRKRTYRATTPLKNYLAEAVNRTAIDVWRVENRRSLEITVDNLVLVETTGKANNDARVLPGPLPTRSYVDRKDGRRKIRYIEPPTARPDEITINTIAHEQNREQLKKLIKRLSLEYRIAVELFYFQDMSMAEICKKLKISKATLGNRLYKARRQLRKLLEDRTGDGLQVDTPALVLVLADQVLEEHGVDSNATKLIPAGSKSLKVVEKVVEQLSHQGYLQKDAQLPGAVFDRNDLDEFMQAVDLKNQDIPIAWLHTVQENGLLSISKIRNAFGPFTFVISEYGSSDSNDPTNPIYSIQEIESILTAISLDPVQALTSETVAPRLRVLAAAILRGAA